MSGCINPTVLALKEARRIWHDEPIGIVVSIGADFSGILPHKLDRDWYVTDNYAKALVNKTAPRGTTEVISEHTINAVKHLISMAVDAKLTHTEAHGWIPESEK